MSSRHGLIALINKARCTGCGWCVASCPWHLLTLEVQQWRKTSTLKDPSACTGCRLCEQRCPFGVITMGPDDDASQAPQPHQTS